MGIGTNNPHHKALLHLEDSTRGFLPTRMTSAQRDTLTHKPEGLAIYNITTHCLEFWNGSQWISTCASTAPCMAPPAPAVSSNSPVCSGQTLNLTASTITGATYIWTGPNGFYSTAQNPSISNANTANSGTYCCKVYVAGCYSTDACVNVNIIPSNFVSKASFPGSTPRVPNLFVANNEVYIIGGITSWCSGFTNTCYKYNPIANIWTSIAPVPVNHAAGHSFSNGTNAWVMNGGYNCGPTTNLVTKYNIATNTWTTSAGTTPIGLHGTTIYYPENSDTLYHIGGRTGDDCCPCDINGTLQRYIASTNTWTTLGNIPNGGRGYLAIMKIKGKLYMGLGRSWVGCIYDRNDWYEFDESTNTWITKATYPGTPGQKFAYFSLGDYGYVVDNNKTIYRYDPDNDSWSAMPCPAPFSSNSVNLNYAVALNGKAYFIDLNNGNTYEWTP